MCPRKTRTVCSGISPVLRRPPAPLLAYCALAQKWSPGASPRWTCGEKRHLQMPLCQRTEPGKLEQQWAAASTSSSHESSNDKQAETFLRFFCSAEPCILAWADDYLGSSACTPTASTWIFFFFFQMSVSLQMTPPPKNNEWFLKKLKKRPAGVKCAATGGARWLGGSLTRTSTLYWRFLTRRMDKVTYKVTLCDLEVVLIHLIYSFTTCLHGR